MPAGRLATPPHSSVLRSDQGGSFTPLALTAFMRPSLPTVTNETLSRGMWCAGAFKSHIESGPSATGRNLPPPNCFFFFCLIGMVTSPFLCCLLQVFLTFLMLYVT